MKGCCQSGRLTDSEAKIAGVKPTVIRGHMKVIHGHGSTRGANSFRFDHSRDGSLSHGATSSVVKATEMTSKQVFAVKTIKIDGCENMQLQQEIEALEKLDSPHICKLFQTWTDSKSIFMVFEFCRGGDLTALSRTKALNEGAISVLVRQMVGAVTHLHQHDLVHGDLKRQDWLFVEPLTNNTPLVQMTLKMVDFGIAARHYNKANLSDEHAGAADQTQARKHRLRDMSGFICAAPEQLDSLSVPTTACDIWALGVLAYFMVSGQAPFRRGTGRNHLDTIRQAQVSFEPAQDWKVVTQEAKSFLSNCLQRQAVDRPHARELLSSSWMRLAKDVFDEALALQEANMGITPKQRGKLSILDAPLPSAQYLLRSFKKMHCRSTLEKAAINAAAHRLKDDKIATLRTSFQKMDKNGDGVLSAQELCEGLRESGVGVSELMDILKDVDMDGDGVIEYTEFVAATYEFQQSMQEHAVLDIFRMFDQDGSGRVTKAEILQSLGHAHAASLEHKFPDLNVDMMLRDLDQDGDGEIDAEEFKQLLLQHTRANPNVRKHSKEKKSSKERVPSKERKPSKQHLGIGR